MGRHIAGFNLPLPPDWHWMPPVRQAPPGWQTPMAERLVPPESRTEEAVAVVAAQLESVYDTVSGLDIEGVSTAVCAAPALAGQLIGMMSMRDRTNTKLPDILMEIAQITQGDATTTYQSVDRFNAMVPAGQAAGAHVIMGTAATDELGQPINILEERIMLGIEPPDCEDVVEITVMSSSLNSFTHMIEYFLALLQPLTIQMKD